MVNSYKQEVDREKSKCTKYTQVVEQLDSVRYDAAASLDAYYNKWAYYWQTAPKKINAGGDSIADEDATFIYRQTSCRKC